MELLEPKRRERIEREINRNAKSRFTWVQFHAVGATSEMEGTSLEELELNNFEPSDRSWECGMYSEFPQEVCIRLNFRAEIAHVILMAKEDRFIPECEILIGDGISGSFIDAEYRVGGIGEQISNVPKQINTFGIGGYIKIVFTKQPAKTVKNPGGQVGLSLLRVWGQPLGYNKGLKNEAHPLQGQTETVDKVLIEMGIPLNNIKWTNEDPENYSYAPVDEDTRVTLIDMEKIKDKAHQTEDYEMLNQVTKDLKVVYDLGNEILNLKRELEIATAKEDYNKAIEIRNRLKQLEQERDRYDALYETSRYEDMIVMARPTSAQRRLAKKLENEERERLEALKRQKEREAEEERLRKLREEQERERLRREEEERKRRQQSTMKTVKKTHFQTVKQSNTVDVGRDPLEYNEGDDDIDPYLNPKLIEAGGKVVDLENSVLKRALHSGTLLVTGVKLWSALHSESWRHRDAAARAFLEYIQAPMKPKYINKTRKLFRAAIDVAMEACNDKLPQIYHTGLDILKTALNEPICGEDVKPKDINNAIKFFVPNLIEKISELNYKVKDSSLFTLVKLFENSKADIRILIDNLMDITEKGPEPDKAPWRIILARLDILAILLQEFGINENVWNWDIVYEKLVIPSFFNQSRDVRESAKAVSLELYRIVGAPVKEMTNNVENIKPNLLQDLNEQFEAEDNLKGGKYYQETGLNQIAEVDEVPEGE